MPAESSKRPAEALRASDARGPYIPEAVLVLLRHGRTERNRKGLLQGVSDYPLDEVGRAQSRIAGEFIRRRYRIDKVASSPRRRALETLEIAGFGGSDVVVEERLREIDYGCFEGEPAVEVSPGLMKAWEADPDFAPPGGESLASLYERVEAACSDLLRCSSGQTVLVVTHATSIKAAVASAMGGQISMILRMFLRPASLSVVASAPSAPSGMVVLAVNECPDFLPA